MPPSNFAFNFFMQNHPPPPCKVGGGSKNSKLLQLFSHFLAESWQHVPSAFSTCFLTLLIRILSRLFPHDLFCLVPRQRRYFSLVPRQRRYFQSGSQTKKIFLVWFLNKADIFSLVPRQRRQFYSGSQTKKIFQSGSQT